ncbi:signal transduction histidine kinase [Brevibacillus aydinogluensis]|jgi:hypothetical protein|uniref:hypothetical protein n=1 Tax=Brevibacillus aydinogluensis TaxID=927786 RepID=UPI000E3AF0E3|nr:hypothetical protein [Brevibacillus aydinogluensis]MDT3415146.1 signal transduction histidine kinase [Brevibacillus aydinogluensis]REK68131.1 MAG: hypothetical protein DF221_00470 [Brevibacillus sp.]
MNAFRKGSLFWRIVSGLAGFLLAFLVWYFSVVHQTLNVLDLFLVLYIVLPAVFAFVVFFIRTPIIAIPFIFTLSLSLFLLFSSALIWYEGTKHLILE